MFINAETLDRSTIQVPEELILRKDVPELLPVYLMLYIKAEPVYAEDEDILTNISIAELTNIIGTLGKGEKRRRQYNRIIKAIEFLEGRGVIYTEEFNSKKPLEFFRYRFCHDMRDVFLSEDRKFHYVLIKYKEYHLLRKLVACECPDGRGAETLYRVYLCLRLRYTLWQKSYIKDPAGVFPVWVGHMNSIATELGVVPGTITNAVATLYNLGLVMPCYGVIPKGGRIADKPETIIALPLLCGEKDPVQIIWNAQDRYRKKPGKEYCKWYPAGSYKKSKQKAEESEEPEAKSNAAEEEVMPEPEQETPPEPPMEELCNTQFCDGWEMPPDNYSDWGLREDEIF